MTMTPPGESPAASAAPDNVSAPSRAPASNRRPTVLAVLALAAAVLGTGALLARRARQEARAQDLLIVQGVRKVCKLSTVEVTLADYARRRVPKTVDLPFTREPEAYLFFSGVVAAGFDVCDEPGGALRVDVDHAAKLVRLRLPPPRVLSLDVKRFETINESTGILNGISIEDRNGWFQDARGALERAALGQGILGRAETHARELAGDLVERWGYKLDLEVDAAAGGEGEPTARRVR